MRRHYSDIYVIKTREYVKGSCWLQYIMQRCSAWIIPDTWNESLCAQRINATVDRNFPVGINSFKLHNIYDWLDYCAERGAFVFMVELNNILYMLDLEI